MVCLVDAGWRTLVATRSVDQYWTESDRARNKQPETYTNYNEPELGLTWRNVDRVDASCVRVWALQNKQNVKQFSVDIDILITTGGRNSKNSITKTAAIDLFVLWRPPHQLINWRGRPGRELGPASSLKLISHPGCLLGPGDDRCLSNDWLSLSQLSVAGNCICWDGDPGWWDWPVTLWEQSSDGKVPHMMGFFPRRATRRSRRRPGEEIWSFSFDN